MRYTKWIVMTATMIFVVGCGGDDGPAEVTADQKRQQEVAIEQVAAEEGERQKTIPRESRARSSVDEERFRRR